MEMRPNAPRATYRPRGEAVLIFERDGSQRVLPLDLDVVSFPPSMESTQEPEASRAIISRVANGHRILVYGGDCRVTVNGNPVTQGHFLQDGDHIAADNFAAAYRNAEATSNMFRPIVLCICPPDGPMVEIRSQRRELVIGRTEGDIIIDDASLDHVHCILTRVGDGQLQIEDCASQHGVFVDGIRTFGQDTLREGSALHIGDTRIMARIEKVLASVPPSAKAQPLDGKLSSVTRHQSAAVIESSKYTQDVRRTFSDDMPTRMEHRQDSASMRPRGSVRHGKGRSVRIPGTAQRHDRAPVNSSGPEHQCWPNTLPQLQAQLTRRSYEVNAAGRYGLIQPRIPEQTRPKRPVEPKQ